MSDRFKKLSSRVIFFSALFLIFLYLLVTLVPFLNPASFWFIAVLGLAFPVLFIIVVICLIVWLVRKSWWALLPAVALVLSWQQIHVAFGFNFLADRFQEDKRPDAIRVLSWNVYRWDEQNREQRGGESYRDLMMDAVRVQSADVLCLQEFFQPYGDSRQYFPDNLQTLKEMGYTYSYFFPSSSIHEGKLRFGMAILSRFPITDSGNYSFGASPHAEGLMYADIKVNNNKTFRFYTVHMESSRLGGNSYFEPGRGLLTRLKTAYSYRTAQADLVYREIANSPHPAVLCGNMGDVPNSYAYFKVSQQMQDAFLKKGSGFGGTFKYITPTLRVDCILADRDLKVQQFNIPDITYSDHYPLVADISFN